MRAALSIAVPLSLALLPVAAGLAFAAPPMGDTPAMGRPDFAAMRARRADDMAMLIGLRADQRPGFDAFLDSMTPARAGAGGGQSRRDDTSPGAEEGFLARLDRMAAMLDARDGEGKARIETARRFYTSLDADQQRRFDAIERLRGGGMMGRMGGGWGRHGPGPQGD